MVWIILAVIAFILLIIYWGGRNAVWGGLTGGIIIGILWKFIGGTDWYIVVRVATITTLLGFGSELLGTTSDHFRKKHDR